MFKAHSVGHPLKCGELKVLEGKHGTSQMGLLGEKVGLEKQTNPHPKKNLTSLIESVTNAQKRQSGHTLLCASKLVCFSKLVSFKSCVPSVLVFAKPLFYNLVGHSIRGKVLIV